MPTVIFLFWGNEQLLYFSLKTSKKDIYKTKEYPMFQICSFGFPEHCAREACLQNTYL